MKRCQTQHKTWYCWHTDGSGGAVADMDKPNDFESLHLADIVNAPNETVALIVYRANLRIKGGRL